MQMVKSEYFTFEDDLIEMITEYVDDMWHYADIKTSSRHMDKKIDIDMVLFIKFKLIEV